MSRIVVAVALSASFLTTLERRAHAASACSNGEGWALPAGATLPTHPRVIYYFDSHHTTGASQPTITATIDGKTVPAKLSFTSAAPYSLAVVEVESDKAGKLVLTWGEATQANGYFQPYQRTANYTISTKLKLPTETKGTASRFHRAYRHSTVHEEDDGLEVRIDAPAIAFTARWRRDNTQAWNTVELTANTTDNHQVARLGALGCNANFQTSTLEAGIDLELDAMLPDGKKIKVIGLPAHYALPPLPKNAPKSSP